MMNVRKCCMVDSYGSELPRRCRLWADVHDETLGDVFAVRIGGVEQHWDVNVHAWRHRAIE